MVRFRGFRLFARVGAAVCVGRFFFFLFFGVLIVCENYFSCWLLKLVFFFVQYLRAQRALSASAACILWEERSEEFSRRWFFAAEHVGMPHRGSMDAVSCAFAFGQGGEACRRAFSSAALARLRRSPRAKDRGGKQRSALRSGLFPR
jgi:hypothetical protein